MGMRRLKALWFGLIGVFLLGSVAYGVRVNPGGKGDALIMGYYNARNALTYIRIVNTSDMGVAGKMRFREGRNSHEVLDFLVCLSPHDEFSLLVVDGGPGAPAKLQKTDVDTTTVPGDWTEVYFRYGDNGADSEVTVEDTYEGYVEFIGIVAYIGAEKLTFSQCEDLVRHGNVTDRLRAIVSEVRDVPNSLFGTVAIVKFSDPFPVFAYNALALADTRNVPYNLSIPLQDDLPLLGELTTIADLNNELAKQAFYVLYDIREVLGGQTDLIITFPTKRETGILNEEAFRNIWSNNDCIDIIFKVYDDKENSPGPDFSPRPVERLVLCQEVNYIVVGEGATPILDTGLHGVNLPTGDFDFGWLELSFRNNAGNVVPAIGYELQSWEGVGSRMLELRYKIPNN